MFQEIKLSERLKAAALHLLISACIGGVFFCWIWFMIYPEPLLETLGAVEIFLILLVVDVTIGPCLTFLIYKKNKKTLKFDLAFIALLQLVAFLYGAHTLWIARPVYIVALGARFDIIQANEVSEEDLQEAHQSLPISGPKWVGYKEAADPEKRADIIIQALGGRDYGYFPQYHAPIETQYKTILQYAEAIDMLISRNPGKEQEILTWLANHNVNRDETVFEGAKTKQNRLITVMINKNTGQVIGMAPFQPWDKNPS